jgi:hypothetical protein
MFTPKAMIQTDPFAPFCDHCHPTADLVADLAADGELSILKADSGTAHAPLLKHSAGKES